MRPANGKGWGAESAAGEYDAAMKIGLPLDDIGQPAALRWFIPLAWVAILAKCAAVWWAIGHWHVPVHPAWVVVPTLGMAALATFLWLVHSEEAER